MNQTSFAVALLLAAAACGSTSKPSPNDEAPVCGAAGTSMCEDGEVRHCIDSVTATFGPPEACPADQVCADTACEPVTPERAAQAAYIEQFVRDRAKYDLAVEVDFDALIARETRRFFLSDGSLYAFMTAIYAAAMDIPNGHAIVGFGATNYSNCYDRSVTGVGFRSYSYYGACARPYQQGAVVTYVSPKANPLNLALGDVVYGLSQNDAAPATGDAFVELLRRSPKCGTTTASLAAQRALAISDIFSVARPGDTLLVRDLKGATRELAVGEHQGDPIDCTDAFARPEAQALFEVSQRPDGVVVVMLPTLGSHPDHPFPPQMTRTMYRDWITTRRDMIADALEGFTNITGLVIDARGNIGGSQELGMALVARLPDVAAGAGICKIRVPESDPPEFTNTGAYLLPYAELTGNQMPAPLSAELPKGVSVVVLVDHGTSSAGDWLAHYAQRHGIPVVGTPHSGGFGFSGGAQWVRRNILQADGAPTTILSQISGAKCYDADNNPMEGVTAVDHFVELAPAEVAVGRDTQLEAAVDVVLSGN